jgi:hypothetical protein
MRGISSLDALLPFLIMLNYLIQVYHNKITASRYCNYYSFEWIALSRRSTGLPIFSSLSSPALTRILILLSRRCILQNIPHNTHLRGQLLHNGFAGDKDGYLIELLYLLDILRLL